MDHRKSWIPYRPCAIRLYKVNYGASLQPVRALTLYADWLEIVNSFKCLGSLITRDEGDGEEVTLRFPRVKSTSANLGRLWRRHDILLSLKGRVYNVRVRSVLLYSGEIWAIHGFCILLSQQRHLNFRSELNLGIIA